MPMLTAVSPWAAISARPGAAGEPLTATWIAWRGRLLRLIRRKVNKAWLPANTGLPGVAASASPARLRLLNSMSAMAQAAAKYVSA